MNQHDTASDRQNQYSNEYKSSFRFKSEFKSIQKNGTNSDSEDDKFLLQSDSNQALRSKNAHVTFNLNIQQETEFIDNDQDENKQEEDQMSPESRLARIKVIFVVLFMTNFIANFDHGIIPALNTTLKEQYDLNNVQMGSLGSIVYFGNVIGCVLGMPMFRSFETRYILLTSLLLQMISLASFTVADNFSAQQFSRFLTGITQVMFTIYVPIWVDLFAPKKSKSLWMTVMVAGVVLGMLLGYIVTALIITFTWWECAFYVQIIVIIPLMMAIAIIKKQFLDVSLETFRRSEGGQPTDGQSDSSESERGQNQDPQTMTQFQLWRLQKLEEQEELVQGLTFWQQFRFILTQVDFLLFMAALTSNFAIICGLQFWTTDYLVQVMGCEKHEAFLIYGISGFIGPVGGIILTALVFDNIGGYTGQKALPICSAVLSVAFACCAMSVVTNNQVVAGCFVCIELFCGAFCMPALTGMMLNSVPKSARTLANSIANMCFNLFGWLPAPSIYGLVYESQGGGESRAGMAAIQSFGFILLSTTVIAYARQRINFSKARVSMDPINLNFKDQNIQQSVGKKSQQSSSNMSGLSTRDSNSQKLFTQSQFTMNYDQESQKD